MTDWPVLFYIFSRTGPPRDEYLQAREEPLKPYGSYNDAGFTVEQPPLPPFMQRWTRYDVSLTEEAFEAYWSDITLPDDLLEGLPDFICLAGHLMVSERARTELNQHAPGCITWIPIQLVGKDSGRAAPGGHQLFFPRISIGYPDSGKPRVPNVNFHPLNNRDLLMQLQASPEIVAYLTRIPLWVMFPSRSDPVFSPELFHLLKAEGFTGLVEKTEEYWTAYEDDETVGHIFVSRKRSKS